MSGTTSAQARWDAVMMRNYGTPPLQLISGKGCYVTDSDGRDYLDLIAGIAVSSLGHGHPALVAAVSGQVATIAHTSNLFINEPALRLAERLSDLVAVSGARVFLCNDGATANEAALKTAMRARPDRRRFVAADGSFHGRTLGILALTGKPAYREPFAPFGVDVGFVPYGDTEALAAAVDDQVAAVFLEPTLGEAGVIVPPAGYLAAARAICDAAGALLVIDEVQGGIGRTGRWFAHQHEGVTPDIVTVAKGLAGGLPLGACIGLGEAADALVRGDHGSTFGGNPVSCAAALAVIDTIDSEGLLHHVDQLGTRWQRALAAVDSPLLDGVRGRGLWLALVVSPGAAPAVERAARDHGFLVNATGPAAVRLAPPLVLSAAESESFTDALPTILATAASGWPRLTS
ncbi:MAG TPA: acetylornithine transaminase [Mycobacteriales bacterium]|jgi:acetylornithine aminotransferase|nr:acetylornithine transaminase [Mycobacteriales bacterium]